MLNTACIALTMLAVHRLGLSQ